MAKLTLYLAEAYENLIILQNNNIEIYFDVYIYNIKSTKKSYQPALMENWTNIYNQKFFGYLFAL